MPKPSREEIGTAIGAIVFLKLSQQDRSKLFEGVTDPVDWGVIANFTRQALRAPRAPRHPAEPQREALQLVPLGLDGLLGALAAVAGAHQRRRLAPRLLAPRLAPRRGEAARQLAPRVIAVLESVQQPQHLGKGV